MNLRTTFRAMAYPGMTADVFQNANISILVCQLFVMVVSLVVVIVSNSKSKAATPAAKL